MKKILLAVAGPLLWASSPTTWEMTSYGDFIKGRFSGISLTRDGRLTLAPKMESLFSTDQPAIWSVVRTGDGVVYVATGHQGKVYRVERSGKGAVYWTSTEPEVFALAVDPEGTLYAGASPDGKVYRIRNGKAAEYFSPGAKYIWALAFGPDGALFVGTGDQGKIFRVTGPGQGELWYDTGQNHVTALSFDKEGRLLAGTEPNGILYRVEGKNRAFVLYDANLPEIRAVATAPDGTVFFAAMGGSLGRATSGSPTVTGGQASPQLLAPGTSITVSDAQGGIEIKPKAEAPKQAAAQPQVTTQISPTIDMSGVEKSAVYRLNPDHTVEPLWSSKDENVYDLAVSGDFLYFSTDLQGRIYQLGADRKATLFTETGEGETVRLLLMEDTLLAATSTLGKLFRLTSGVAAEGWFESPVHDAGSVARWGRISWKAEAGAGSKITFRTRSGNSARPDNTWSDWSAPLQGADGVVIPSPNARFIQWRVELSGSRSGDPVLDSVTVSYLPQNQPPILKGITVSTQSPAGQAQQAPAPSSGVTATYSITVTDSGDAGSAGSAGTPTQTPGRPAAAQLKIAWQAEDPDGDKLTYSLYFRGEDEREWKRLKSDFSETMTLIDADALADGRYFFRVTASDRQANPPEMAREAEMVSPPVLIDNTPPLVRLSAPRQDGAWVRIEAVAEDATSPLRRAEYSIDAGGWKALAAADGVIDSRNERFQIVLPVSLVTGERLVVVRVYDAAGNAGLAKVLIRPPLR